MKRFRPCVIREPVRHSLVTNPKRGKQAQKVLSGFLDHLCLLCFFVANDPNASEDQERGDAGSPG